MTRSLEIRLLRWMSSRFSLHPSAASSAGREALVALADENCPRVQVLSCSFYEFTLGSWLLLQHLFVSVDVVVEDADVGHQSDAVLAHVNRSAAQTHSALELVAVQTVLAGEVLLRVEGSTAWPIGLLGLHAESV